MQALARDGLISKEEQDKLLEKDEFLEEIAIADIIKEGGSNSDQEEEEEEEEKGEGFKEDYEKATQWAVRREAERKEMGRLRIGNTMKEGENRQRKSKCGIEGHICSIY